MKACAVVALLLVGVALCVAGGAHAPQGADWSKLDQVLTQAIQSGAFPGCVALVGNKDTTFYVKAFGHFTYGDPAPVTGTNPPMSFQTLFDMASVTKVIATTTAIMTFYQRGELPLGTKICSPTLLGPAFAVNDKENITVLNCLLHNTGYPPDPDPNYLSKQFGCPESANYHPDLSFSCQQQIYKALLAQPLINRTGANYVYSDLSMITLMYVVGKLAKDLGYIEASDLIPGCDQGPPGHYECYYEAYVRKHVFEEVGMSQSGFLPAASRWGSCAPTWNDTTYRHRIVQGQVSDENAYALGGISGHAGLFSTIGDVTKFVRRLMYAPEDDPWINATTVKLFRTEYNHSQSSRALGWNTNDPTVYDYGWFQHCKNLSSVTYMHDGFTGTECCLDPVREAFTVLLTNRVYPDEANEKISEVRQQFNAAAAAALDAVLHDPHRQNVLNADNEE